MKMKLLSCLLILALAISALPMAASAALPPTEEYDGQENGFYYAIENGEATVCEPVDRYSASMANVVIPQTLGGAPVTAIGTNAFWGNSSIQTLTLPDTLKEIHENAFSGCSGITKLVLSDGLTTLQKHCFSGCTGLTAVALPASLQSMDFNAFTSCENVVSITVDGQNPYFVAKGNCLIETATGCLITGCQTSQILNDGSVKSIGAGAFWGVTLPADFSLPQSLTKIEERAFMEAKGLGTMEIPAGVKSIGNSCFYMSDLQKAVLHEGLQTIGTYAFWFCPLKEIHLPDTVTFIGSHAFVGCQMEQLAFPKGMTEIVDQTVVNCQQLKEITIPASVTQMGYAPFEGVTNLETIQVDADNPVFTDMGNCLINKQTKVLLLGCANSAIPDDGTVTEIAQKAFAECVELTSIVIPDAVTVLGAGAFMGCENLQRVQLSASLTWVSDSSFAQCKALQEIVIPEGVTELFGLSFGGKLERLYLPQSLTYVSYYNSDFHPQSMEVFYAGTKEQWDKIKVEDLYADDFAQNVTPKVQCNVLVPTSTDIEPGDVNGDLAVDAKDALLVLKTAVGTETLTEPQKERADVNGDGAIDAKDALAILKKAVEK